MELREIVWDAVDWMNPDSFGSGQGEVAGCCEDGGKQVPYKAGNYLTS